MPLRRGSLYATLRRLIYDVPKSFCDDGRDRRWVRTRPLVGSLGQIWRRRRRRAVRRAGDERRRWTDGRTSHAASAVLRGSAPRARPARPAAVVGLALAACSLTRSVGRRDEDIGCVCVLAF